MRGHGGAPAPEAAFQASSVLSVIDLETTGLDASTSRVVECAIIQLDGRGATRSEWSSLIRVDGEVIGASAVHHIEAPTLAGAPSFSEVAGEIVSRLRGRIVVGHVVGFDLEHLAAEFARLGAPLPNLAPTSLCTRELAERSGMERPRTLLGCCRATGVALRGAHTALGDARSTAGLLRHFLALGLVDNLPARLRAADALDWPTPQTGSDERPLDGALQKAL